MPNFDSGVSGYVRASCVIEVGFPIDWNGKSDIRCEQCPYFGRTSRTCQLNKKPVAYPEKYVGQDCPLEVEEENELF